MKHILKLLIFCCIFVTIDLKAQTPTSVPYSFGFEGGFGNWVNDDNLWKIGSGTDGQAFNSLSSASEGSNYAYIQTDKISVETALYNTFDFSNIKQPIISFKVYFYANDLDNNGQPVGGMPSLKILTKNSNSQSWTTQLTIKDDGNLQDGWNTINCCLSNCSDISNIILKIVVNSSTSPHKIAIDDLQIKGMNISIKNVNDVSCYGYNDGEIEIEVSGGGPYYKYSCDNGLNWSNVENSNSYLFQNLKQGLINIVVEDQISGCLITNKQNISQPPEIEFQIINTNDITCFTNSDGSFEVKVEDGLQNSPFQFSKNNGVDFTSNNIFTGLSANIYDVVVKNSVGCVSKPQQVDIGSNVLLEIHEVLTTDVEKCYGDRTGKIEIVASGSQAPISYSTDNGASFSSNGNRISGLTAGTYTIWVKDKNNCKVKWPNPVVINQPEQLIYEKSDHEDVTGCFGDCNGTITPHVHGGSGDYYFSKDRDNNVYQPNITKFEGLNAGTYKMGVSDSKGCIAVGDDITIYQPEKLIIDKVEFNDVSTCYGGDNGTISITASGGTAPLSYSIDENNSLFQNVETFTNLTKGFYYPNVKDNNGCAIKYDQIELREPDRLVMQQPSSSSRLNRCFGDSYGVIATLATGGTYPYTFTIDDFSTTITINRNDNQMAQFNNVPAGTYTVKLKDAHNCISNNENVVITQPSQLSMDVDVVVGKTSCWSGNDGEVELSATGGTPYTNLEDGSSYYSFGIRRVGQTEYSWKIDNILHLNVGNYELAVKDNNGCSITYSTPIQINEPNQLVLSPQPYDVSTCYGDKNGAIDVFVSGGTAPFKYSIDNGESFQTDYQFENLAGDNYYSIIVVDSKGCKETKQLYVGQPNQIEISNLFYDSEIKGCKGEKTAKISFLASGGYGTLRYSINNGLDQFTNGTFNNLPAGKYIPFVIDGHGCHQSFAEIEILEPEKLVINNIETVPASCFGKDNGEVHFTVSGGKCDSNYPYKYYLDYSPDPTFESIITGLQAREYEYSVVDEVGCTLSGNFTISQPEEIKFVQKDTTNVEFCYGDYSGTATLKAVGGVAPITYIAHGNNYYEENLTGFFDKMPASNYEFIAKDANECELSEYASIIQPEKLQYFTNVENTIKCYGDDSFNFIVNVSGGTTPYKYSLNNGKSYEYSDNHFANVKPGNYFVKVMDAKGCTQPYNYQIEVIEPPLLQIEYEKYDVVCNTGNTGKIIASSKGGTQPYYYSMDSQNWKPVTGVFSNLTDSTYIIKVKDANGCIATTDQIILTRPDNIAGFKLDTYEGCSPLDVVITQDFAGLANYEISDGSKIYDRTGPTKHTFVNTTQNPKSFTIKSSMMQISGIGCTDTASVNLIVYPRPVSDLRILADSVVFPETTAYFANMTQGVNSAIWDFGDGTYSNNIYEQSHEYTTCGNYNIILIQSDGRCSDTISTPFVIQGRPVIANMKSSSLEGCQPITIQFQNSSSNADSCVWNFGDGTTSTSDKLSHTFETAGDFEVSLTAYGDCGNATTTTKIVHVYAKPSAAFIQNADTLYEGQSLRLECESSNTNFYKWDFGDGQKSEEKNPIHLYEFGGVFNISLVVVTSNSCSDTSVVSNAITVIENPIVVFPNAFTPNGDGINDIFKPVHGDIAKYDITILDKKGTIMYRGNNIDEGWDGTRNGRPCPTGVYVYKANIVLRDKSFFVQTGYIVLLKIDVKK